jgi:hypothetical protein
MIGWDGSTEGRKAFVFVIGVFHGDSKPDNANEYLSDLIAEAILLERAGFAFRNIKVTIRVTAFVCDAPARSFSTCDKGHTAYFGCYKCVTEGEYFVPNINNPKSGRVTYPQTNAPLRTSDSFRARVHKNHHTGYSILEQLMIYLVDGIPLDSLHLTDLGLMRKSFKAVLGVTTFGLVCLDVNLGSWRRELTRFGSISETRTS